MASTPPATKTKPPNFHTIAQTIVTVKVGSEGEPFSVHKDLRFHHSGYFQRAFNGRFGEGQKGVAILNDVDAWTFKTFVNWLYCQQILFTDEKKEIDSSNEKVAVDAYIFGDRFDVLGFRQAIFERFFHYCLPRGFTWGGISPVKIPSLQAVSQAFTNLPETSSLHRFLLDILGYRWPIHRAGTEDLDKIAARLPPKVLVQLFARATGSRAKSEFWTNPPWLENPCQYHEHVDDEEEKRCKKIWETVRHEHETARKTELPNKANE